jgi:flagellar biosynthetic protein FliQ
MTPLEVIDIGRDGLIVLMQVAAPAMAVALVVGLMIALFQALTQIQEMTLTFVPKILAIFVTLIIVLPFMFETLHDYQQRLAEKIVDQDRIADIPIIPEKDME